MTDWGETGGHDIMTVLEALKNRAKRLLGKEEDAVRIVLDFLTYTAQEAVAYGWAFAKDGSECEIEVTDAEGKAVPAKTDRDRREDVCAAFGLSAEARPGYRTKIDLTKKRPLPFTLTARSGKRSHSLPLQIETDRAKRIGRWADCLSGKIQSPPIALTGYDDWRFCLETDADELERQRQTRFAYEPLISIAVPLYNTPQDYLKEMIDSVLSQTYGRFELCLADGSTSAACRDFISSHYSGEERIRYRMLEKNEGISENTNEAIAMASGDYLMLADHDDVLDPGALYSIVEAMQEDPESADVIYTDEDKISFDSQYRFDPSLKPDFDPFMLRSFNYFTHITVIRMDLVRSAGGERKEFDGAQDYDLTLRCVENAKKVIHVPKVLYHWRAHLLSTAGNPESKLYAYENGRKAIDAHLSRMGIPAHAEMTPFWGRYAVHADLTPSPRISVLLFGRSNAEEKTRQSLAKTGWVKQILPVPDRSASAVRAALDEVQGDTVLFLANGADFTNENALTDLIGITDLPGNGFTGTRLVRKGKIWNAGYILDECGPVPALTDHPDNVFTFAGIGNLTHSASATSAACLAVKKSTIDAAGGWPDAPDAESAAIDLCVRIRALGLTGAVHPYSEVTLPDPAAAELTEEGRKWLLRHLMAERKKDPYYHPYLDPSVGNYHLIGEYFSEDSAVNEKALELARKALKEAEHERDPHPDR